MGRDVRKRAEIRPLMSLPIVSAARWSAERMADVESNPQPATVPGSRRRAFGLLLAIGEDERVSSGPQVLESSFLLRANLASLAAGKRLTPTCS